MQKEKWEHESEKILITSVEQVRKLALQFYNDGGDGVYECYEDFQIQEEIDNGRNTQASWLRMFRVFESVTEDIRNS